MTDEKRAAAREERIRRRESISTKDRSQRGRYIIDFLGLKIKKNGRVDTSWGDKTPSGLYLTLRRIIERGFGND